MMGKKSNEVKISTLIGADSEINGNFTSGGSVRVDGRVNGDVSVSGMLIVGDKAVISGSVTAKSSVIGGEVLGNVNSDEKTELTETAKVLGDISTSVIIIDEHAIFQGRCDMKQDVPDGIEKNHSRRAAKANRKSYRAAIEEALKEVAEESAEDSPETAEAAATAEETPDNGSFEG